MAPRRGADIEQDAPLGGLNFNQPLSWRAGKPISTGDLLKRLDTLSDELREMDQEETDKNSLTSVAKELASPNLLNHKDKGVRAFSACCLVDILKICAPDAPFTASQLKDIFTLFITSILPALSDPSSTYNNQHKYVLVSLSEVKSIVLVNDLPNADALTLHLFTSFFDVVSGSAKNSTGEQIAKDVILHMIQIQVTLIDEAASLPTQVVDIIVAQFLRACLPGGGASKTKNGDISADDKQSTLLPKELPDAYNMAAQVCNLLPEKMARYVSQYFNDVILDFEPASNGPSKANGHRRSSDAVGSDDEDAPTGPTEADLKELGKAHKLLRELWRACPDVLQNVIPQLEAELEAENVQLRLLATETLGDIISGIGAAGPPPLPLPSMDPAAYPPVMLEDYPSSIITDSILTTPASKHSFTQTHSSLYQKFIGRKHDKSLVIRSGWTTAIGRILVTSAGGIGLSREEETALVKALAEKLNDPEEKVRLAAVKAMAGFNLRDIMTKLAPNGDVLKSGSVLCSLADRVRDRKSILRAEAMTILGKIWGVATGEIAAGNESVVSALGGIPTRILDAYYANDLEINVLLDHVLFEQLVPLSYPPKKAKGAKATNGDSQNQANGGGPIDADRIRTERILLLVKSLNTKSKKALFAMQARQKSFSEVLTVFLKRCEDYNGGVVDGDTKEAKQKLDVMINWLSKTLPDPLRISTDLQKYAKMHERRTYALLRFAMDPEKDFKTVYNSIKEFSKRVVEAPNSPAGLMDTLMPIIYRSSSLLYNKSHLPAILQFSGSNEHDLGATAHELNHEISEKLPQVFMSNVKELCKLLEDDVPSETEANESGSVETLRTLAQFARARPHDLPKDRKFVQTLISFALYGTPAKAAKHAVSILMAATERKEMHIKDLLEKTTKDWAYGEGRFLTKLATISQLELLDSKLTDGAGDDILDITTRKVLLQVRMPKDDTNPGWQPESEMDEECQAKCWALKILVNRLRATADDTDTAEKLAEPVYKLLNVLIMKEGELSKALDTPKHHKSRLRLVAAQLMLKLCQYKTFDKLLTSAMFNQLAFVAQDPRREVRRGFIEKLQKYLVNGKLSARFYTIIFLTAYEPELKFKASIETWIRSQTKAFDLKGKHVIEPIFARLLSLLAHHPDYNEEPEDLKDLAQYILYYLTSVSSEENLGLIYKYAERVKQSGDAISPADSDRLYVMSDLAQAVIRKWELKKGWRLQVYPGKIGLSGLLFTALPTHEVAQTIAEKEYLPEGVDDLLERLVRDSGKKSKRKADDGEANASSKKVKSEPKPKSVRTSTSKPAKERKTPKPKKQKSVGSFSTPAANSVERRKSNRGTNLRKIYADRDSEDDDEEMLDGVAEWEYLDAKELAESDDDNPTEVEPKEVTPEKEPAPQVEIEAESEAEEVEERGPTPPRLNSKATQNKKEQVIAAKPTRVTKSKARASLVTKAKTPLAVKAKAPIAKTKAKPAIKGKAKSRTKNVFDIDESE